MQIIKTISILPIVPHHLEVSERIIGERTQQGGKVAIDLCKVVFQLKRGVECEKTGTLGLKMVSIGVCQRESASNPHHHVLLHLHHHYHFHHGYRLRPAASLSCAISTLLTTILPFFSFNSFSLRTRTHIPAMYRTLSYRAHPIPL